MRTDKELTRLPVKSPFKAVQDIASTKLAPAINIRQFDGFDRIRGDVGLSLENQVYEELEYAYTDQD